MSDNSTFSNLMSYLEEYEHEKDNASLGPTRSIISSTAGMGISTSRYIWDNPEEFSKSTSASARNSVSRQSVSATSSVEDVGMELKLKIKEMRNEIKMNKDEAKALQTEYVRLSNVKSRKIERRRKAIDSHLIESEQEQSVGVKKQQDFQEKVKQDILTLQKKYDTLQEKLKSMQVDRVEEIHKAERLCRQKQQRALQQLEVEEKQSIDKVIQSKLPALKKNAADSFGPKLDEFVRNGKSESSLQLEKYESNLKALQQTLMHEKEAKVLDCRNKLEKQGKLQLLKEKQEVRSRVHECQLRMEREWNELKLSDERTRERVTQSMQHQRDASLQDIHSNVSAVREMHSKSLRECLLLQNEELSVLNQQLHSEREALRSRLLHEKEKFRTGCVEKMMRVQEHQVEKELNLLKAELAREKQQVLQSLRAEVEKERVELKQRYENELTEFRQSIDKEMHANGDRGANDSSYKLTEVRNGIDQLKDECRKSEENGLLLTAELTKLQLRDKQLASQLVSLNDKLASLGNSDEEEVIIEDSSIIELNAQKSRVRNHLVSLEKDKSLMGIEFEKKIAKLKQQNQEDLNQIRMKVDAIVRRKQNELQSLQIEHSDLVQEVQRLSSHLEVLREQALNS